MSAAVRRGSRGLSFGAVAYVTAWVLGLAIVPAAPTGATPAELHAHFVSHRTAVAIQSLLVHGAAGIALMVVAVALRRTIARRSADFRFTGIATAGVAAGLLSLAQVAALLVLVGGLDSGQPDRTAAWHDAINLLDTAKLTALAGFALAAVRSARPGGLMPVWLGYAGFLLAPLLLLGALSFILNAAVLTLGLYASLPLLLVWVLGVGLSMAGESKRRAPEVRPAQ